MASAIFLPTTHPSRVLYPNTHRTGQQQPRRHDFPCERFGPLSISSRFVVSIHFGTASIRKSKRENSLLRQLLIWHLSMCSPPFCMGTGVVRLFSRIRLRGLNTKARGLSG
eukprot:3367920-Pleurochrysis_carterae.AAC.1